MIWLHVYHKVDVALAQLEHLAKGRLSSLIHNISDARSANWIQCVLARARASLVVHGCSTVVNGPQLLRYKHIVLGQVIPSPLAHASCPNNAWWKPNEPKIPTLRSADFSMTWQQQSFGHEKLFFQWGRQIWIYGYWVVQSQAIYVYETHAVPSTVNNF